MDLKGPFPSIPVNTSLPSHLLSLFILLHGPLSFVTLSFLLCIISLCFRGFLLYFVNIYL